MNTSRSILALFCAFLVLELMAQSAPSLPAPSASSISGESVQSQTDSLKKVFLRQHQYNLENPEEKSYLHTDKSFYNVGDTIWFKAYTVFAAGFYPDTLNSTLYVDLVNQDGKVVREINVRLRQGLGRGQISVADSTLSPGHYKLRAYSSWMRNFGEEPLFTKVLSLYTLPKTDVHWLVDQRVVSSVTADSLKVSFTLTDGKYKMLSEQPVEYWFKSSSDNLMTVKGNISTDKAGRGAFNLLFPKGHRSQTGTLSLVVGTKKDPIVSNFAISLTPPATQVDFLPEGGYQVLGISSRVGFKITDETGRGLRASGEVFDQNGERITRFSTYLEGMGSFTLTPQPGKQYQSRIVTIRGDTLVKPLPTALAEGSVLEVQSASLRDSIIVLVKRSGRSVTSSLGLLIQNGDRRVSQLIVPSGRIETRLSLPRKAFPAGISQITLFNDRGTPLAERLVFNSQYAGLRIEVTPSQPTYKAREKVALNLKATDATGHPVQGEFSVSVTDLEQVTDTLLKDNNILTHMLLSSELKGYIAQPGFYFRDSTLRRRIALENLLMTQGWRRYRWESALKKDTLQYEFEPGVPIAGQVKNITFGTPLKGFKVTMLIGDVQDSVMSNHPSQPKKWGWEVPKTGLLGTDTTVFEYVRGMRLKDYSVTYADELGRFSLYSRLIGKQTMVLQTQRYAGPIEKRIDIRDMSDMTAQPFGSLYEGRPGEKEAFLREQQRVLARIRAEQRQKEDLFDAEMKKIYGDVAWSLMLKEVEVSTTRNVQEFADKKAAATVLVQDNLNFVRNHYNYGGASVADGAQSWLEVAYPNETSRVSKWTGSESMDYILWKGRYMASIYVTKPTSSVRAGGNCYESYKIIDNLTFEEEQELKDILYAFYPSLVEQFDAARTTARESGIGSGPPVYVLYFPFEDGHCEMEQLGVRTYQWKGYDIPKEYYSPDYSKPQGELKTIDFRPVLYWAPVVRTDAQGNGKLEFYTDDRAKILRVDVQGITPQGTLGAGLKELKIR